MNLYDKYILPRFLNFVCGTKHINYQREKIVPLAEGAVLEVGIGSGLNLPFYNKSRIEKVWGLDPSKELNNMAVRVASTLDFEVDFILSGAEKIPLPDKTIDTILITYTLCSITEVAKSLDEMKRVLKTSGNMLFCEHGLAPDDNVAKWQGKITPYWKKIAGGCCLNRDIPKLIKNSGFKIDTIETMYLPGTPKFASFNYWGQAKPFN